MIEFNALNKMYALPREIQIEGKPRQNMSDIRQRLHILMNGVALLEHWQCRTSSRQNAHICARPTE